MRQLFVAAETFLNENGMMLSLDDDAGFEACNITCSTRPQLHIEFKNYHETYADYVSPISPAKDFKIRARKSVSTLSKWASVYGTPINLSSSKLLFEGIKHHSRTGSMNDLGGFVLGSPKGEWGFNLIEKTMLKSSLLFQMGSIAGVKDRPDNSSTISGSSYQSSSSSHSCISRGLLRCFWKGDVPNFSFSVDTNKSLVYVANLLKTESSLDKAVDYVYVFHSRISNMQNPKSDVSNKLDYLGKMKVSSSLVLHSDKSKYTETEFVLVGTRGVATSLETKKSSKRKYLSEKVIEKFRPTRSSKHKSTHITDVSNSEIEETSTYGSYLETDLDDDFQTNLELAAIVVKDHHHDSNNRESAIGGWGLKFLTKAKDEIKPHESSFSSTASEEVVVLPSDNVKNSSRSTDVLIPAGLHGGPVNRSIIERWKSHGGCDCGGWDIGCPLRVLSSTSNSSDVCLKECQEDIESVALFAEGKENGEAALRMEKTDEGTYYVYFRSSISALQSFSIAVAMIHSRTPTLSPEL